MNAAIETLSLCRNYRGVPAVRNLNLQIETGTLYALLGVNGAGKSTAIKMLSCLLRPTSGDALILGHSITREPDAVKRLISVSPQETAIARNLTVQENLEFIAGIYGASPAEARQAAASALEQHALLPLSRKRAGTLSGGWQRRLSIAMAMISQPRILFLDEPTLGLDVLARRELWTSILAQKGKTTIILTTHYLEEAAALADRVGILSAGSLLAQGTPEELIRKAGKTSFEDAFVTLVGGDAT